MPLFYSNKKDAQRFVKRYGGRIKKVRRPKRARYMSGDKPWRYKILKR